MSENGIKEIRRERVDIPSGMSVEAIMEQYGLKRPAALMAIKKGFYVKNYMKKQVVIDASCYNPTTAYIIARKVFKRNFSRDPVAIVMKEDLIQEAVTRMYELSGKVASNNKYSVNYQYHWVGHNAMQSFLKTWRRQMRYKKLYELFLNAVIRSNKRKYHPTFGWLYC